MINSGIIIVDMTVTTLDRCKQELNIVSCRRHWTRLYSTPITWSSFFTEYRGAPTDNMTEL